MAEAIQKSHTLETRSFTDDQPMNGGGTSIAMRMKMSRDVMFGETNS